MKGTPRKECNKTKVKWVRLEGGGWKRKRKKILDFQPAAWERSVFLPVSQAPWNEKAKQTCSPRLYLVNHQHYKPVLQALWGRKRGREGKKEWKKISPENSSWKRQAVKKQWLIEVEHVLCYLSKYLTTPNVQQTSVSICPPFVQILPLLLFVVTYCRVCPIVGHGALCAVGVLTSYGCPHGLPAGSEAWSGNSALCAGMWLHREVNNLIGKLAWPLINSCCLCDKTMAGKPKTLFNPGPYLSAT